MLGGGNLSLLSKPSLYARFLPPSSNSRKGDAFPFFSSPFLLLSHHISLRLPGTLHIWTNPLQVFPNSKKSLFELRIPLERQKKKHRASLCKFWLPTRNLSTKKGISERKKMQVYPCGVGVGWAEGRRWGGATEGEGVNATVLGTVGHRLASNSLNGSTQRLVTYQLTWSSRKPFVPSLKMYFLATCGEPRRCLVFGFANMNSSC